VVITSAENLLKEIFTIKGSGTFIKYHRIKNTSDPATINKKKMKALLEDAFGKKLLDTYFEGQFKEIIYEKDYEGVAIMKEVQGIPYLDKFAVAKAYQGTGLGKSLWNEVIRSYPSLLWRAAATNPFNEVYIRYCDGMIKGTEWIVFWKNLEMDKVIPCIDEIMNREKTMITVSP
ncbi:hypothetical protein HZB01_05355, partial [Candidatus Woesearchaeota archaeon]|nr:hypothetical protein [Candidatus Woesearchaeota archaeon]